MKYSASLLILTVASGVMTVAMVDSPNSDRNHPEAAARTSSRAHNFRAQGLAAEVERIQVRLRAVERDLFARPVPHLSPAQRAARKRAIARLHEYRIRGRFPHNHDFPGRRVSYFIDEHGTLCAVAYLIAQSGRMDLVERIAANRNNATVPELADNPALVNWLEKNGLTLAEAARIQPAYDWIQPSPDPEISPEYALGTALATGVASAAIVLNWPSSDAGSGGSGWWRGAAGIGSGLAGILMGVHGLDKEAVPTELTMLNIGMGAAASALATATLGRAIFNDENARPTTSDHAESPQLSAMPYLGMQSGFAPGIRLRLRF